jgi:hypothetical protein
MKRVDFEGSNIMIKPRIKHCFDDQVNVKSISVVDVIPYEKKDLIMTSF